MRTNNARSLDDEVCKPTLPCFIKQLQIHLSHFNLLTLQLLILGELDHLTASAIRVIVATFLLFSFPLFLILFMIYLISMHRFLNVYLIIWFCLDWAFFNFGLSLTCLFFGLNLNRISWVWSFCYFLFIFTFIIAIFKILLLSILCRTDIWIWVMIRIWIAIVWVWPLRYDISLDFLSV